MNTPGRKEKRYDSIRFFSARLQSLVDFVFPVREMTKWAVIVLVVSAVLMFARQFTAAGILLALSVGAAGICVSLRFASDLIWIAADIADELRMIRNALDEIRNAPLGGKPHE